jgi:hypothetical protein
MSDKDPGGCVVWLYVEDEGLKCTDSPEQDEYWLSSIDVGEYLDDNPWDS